MQTAIWLGLVIIVGMLIPVQAGLNATFGKIANNPLLAGCWNTLLATLIFIAALMVYNVPLPTVGVLSRVPWWAFLGGVCGAIYVFVSLMAVSRLGAVLLIIGLVAGQMLASVLLDHFGWVGYAVRPISFARVFGIVCIVVGIYFVQR